MDDLNSVSPLGSPAAITVDPRDADDRVAVVQVDGELDLNSSPQLRRTLYALLDAGRDRLVLDFSHVSFMDSTALSVLVGIDRRLATEGRLAIAGAGTGVLSVFELSGLAASFHHFQTRDSALGYAQGGCASPGAPPATPLTADAALMLGIASTAMPFARSSEDQVVRWLRVLRRYGECGAVLASLGVSEAPIRDLGEDADGEHRIADGADMVAEVIRHAGRLAAQRKAAKVTTTDLLQAVMHVYGASFERVLGAHGGDIEELVAQLASPHSESSEG